MNRRTAPITQVEIEHELLRLMDALEDETEAFETLAEDAATKEARYKHAWASEYIAAKGSIKEREAWADYRLENELFHFKIAEALLKAKRERLTSLRSSLDAMRTLNANVRTMVS